MTAKSFAACAALVAVALAAPTFVHAQTKTGLELCASFMALSDQHTSRADNAEKQTAEEAKNYSGVEAFKFIEQRNKTIQAEREFARLTLEAYRRCLTNVIEATAPSTPGAAPGTSAGGTPAPGTNLPAGDGSSPTMDTAALPGAGGTGTAPDATTDQAAVTPAPAAKPAPARKKTVVRQVQPQVTNVEPDQSGQGASPFPNINLGEALTKLQQLKELRRQLRDGGQGGGTGQQQAPGAGPTDPGATQTSPFSITIGGGRQ